MANGNNSSNPLQAYGYDQQTGQQLADSLGITTQALAAAFAATPLTGGGPSNQSQFLGGSSVSTGYNAPSRDLTQTVNQLQIAKAAGLGAGAAGQAAPVNTSASGGPFTDPMNLAGRMGAAALGMPQIINPTPGQIPQGKGGIGGVAQVASPVVSSDVPAIPGGPWNTNAGVFANQQQAQGMQGWQQLGSSGNLADAAAAEKAMGFAPGTVAKGFAPYGGPSNTPPPTAGGTPTPMMPANASAGRVASPYATAPPAPGATASAPAQANWAPLMGGPPSAPAQGGSEWSEIATHTAGLQNAGKAIFSHLTGGDPEKASTDDITNFHNQLQTALAAGQVPGSNYTAGVNQPPNTSPTAKMMAGGGVVPGRGNRDTVPALLTPGEYVIPKAQAAQLFGGRTPLRMAEGGYVPPEVRRQRITPPGSSPAAPQAQTSTSQSPQQSSSSPAAAGGGQGQQGYWSNMVNQAMNRQYGTPSSATPAGGWPSQTPSVAPSYDMPSDPDPDWQYTGQPSTAGLTGAGNMTGAQMGAGVADVAGGLISGLAQAAATYAASIKPFIPKGQAFGNQPPPNYQNVNFQQDTTV
jgi:hypothetical protein